MNSSQTTMFEMRYNQILNKRLQNLTIKVGSTFIDLCSFLAAYLVF